MGESRPKGKHSALGRAGAALVAVALVPAAWGLLVLFMFGGLFNAQVPNPRIPDGDPCCGYPDTWTEVGNGLAWALVTGFAGILALRVACLLARGAASSWTPHRARWRCALVTALALPALTFGASLGISAASRQPTEYAMFAFDGKRSWSNDRDIRRKQASGVSDCGLPGSVDLTGPEVRALLGDPQSIDRGRHADITVWHCPDVEVEFEHGKVVYQQIYRYEDSPWG